MRSRSVVLHRVLDPLLGF
uniref:Uncharacterized protein n=1 Tax=Arundo donax TaxID=35708 RepID=A0A0A9C732_ARUDO